MIQNNNNQGGKREINLQQLAQNFMSGMQRHFDMLAFNLASRETVTEASYKQIAHAPRIMPVPAQHQNFEQTQAYAHDLLLKQLVNDALNLAVSVMHNAHFFLAMVKCTEGKPELASERQHAAEALQKAFCEARFDQKFNLLEENYSIRCELEDTITSLGFCLQALVESGGKVGSAHLDENGELSLEFKAVSVPAEKEAQAEAPAKLTEYLKVFREGDYVTFNNKELQLILVTVSAFADSLFKSIANYTQSMQEKN